MAKKTDIAQAFLDGEKVNEDSNLDLLALSDKTIETDLKIYKNI